MIVETGDWPETLFGHDGTGFQNNVVSFKAHRSIRENPFTQIQCPLKVLQDRKNV